MKVARCCWPLALASACRIGGPSADPLATVEFPSDAADATSTSPESGGDDALEAGVSRDATSPSDASNDASLEASTRGDADAGDVACTPPSVAGPCNPVTNTGCTLTQCDIDTTQATPTGACVAGPLFPADAGSPCTQSSTSVSCQPRFTCFGGSCQKVCFCNSDCDNNTCCSGRAGTTGFGLCGACH